MLHDSEIRGITQGLMDMIEIESNQVYYKVNHATPEQREMLFQAVKAWIEEIGLEVEKNEPGNI